jgi:ATP-dependent DNA helicase RecQ
MARTRTSRRAVAPAEPAPQEELVELIDQTAAVVETAPAASAGLEGEAVQAEPPAGVESPAPEDAPVAVEGEARANGAPQGQAARSGRRRRRRRGQQRHEAPRPSLDDADEVLPPEEEPPGPATPVTEAARRLGIRRLHAEQERGIAATLAGRDVLMVLPTGFGKSACYQVPSMVLPKPVVLISPLLALLKDQHEKLIKHEIPCVRLDGTVRGKARAAALARVREGGSLLVMTTPESLGSEEVSGVLRESGISLAAIDEAHCISEWGYDFRPAYLQIGERLRGLGAPPLMGLTATATEKVRADVVRFLGMRDPLIVAGSPHRSNLAFEVLECREATRLRALARLAQRLRRPGIIYCTTTREVDTVFAIMARLGIPSHRYHGKMAAGERSTQQEMFMKPGRRTVMVATSAFGLGIDKPDIRYVVHQNSPASLEQYVQEAGRAGRDGAKANCILLHDPADRATHEALLSRSRLRPDQLYRLGSALAAWAGERRTPAVDVLALSAELGERATNALLVPIEEAGIIRYIDEGKVEVLVQPEQVEEQVRSLAGQFATLRTQDSRRLDSIAEYAQSTECRAAFLRTYFGEEHGEACGLCDICRGRPERPTTFWSPIAAPPRHGKKRKRGRGAQPQPSAKGNRRARGRNRQNPNQGGNRERGGAPFQRPRAEAPAGFAPPPNPSHGQPGNGPDGGQPRSSRRRRGRRRRRPRPDLPPPTPSPAS